MALVGVMTVAAGPALAGHARAATDIPPLQPVTTDQYTALPEEDFMVPTRAGDVYVQLQRPDVPAGTTVPVILTSTPYAALGASPSDGVGTYFIPKGYARAIAHVIGTGNSGGCWDYGGRNEQLSTYDLVEYLGTRSWSNGKVGMIGGSYDGTTANEAGALNPPHLATIVPEVAINHWYGYAYYGGIRYGLMDPAQRQGLIIDEEGFDTPAGFDFGFGLAPGIDPVDDPSYAGHFVERTCPGLDKVFHTQRGYNFQPDYDRFWSSRDYARRGARLATPDGQEITMLVQGGWRDYNVKHSESTGMFNAVPVDNPSTPADEGVPYKMLVMGQGAHGGVEPDMGWDVLLHAWFDRWLYGYQTNIETQPALISKTNDGVIHHDETWPPPGTAGVNLYLHQGQLMSTAKPGTGEGSESYQDNPAMDESKALNLMGTPGNQQVLWFVSKPLSADLRISGHPLLKLFASSSMSETHYTPVLFDLGPPVTTTSSICTFESQVPACTVSRGFLNARYRNGLAHGSDLTPNQTYVARIGFIDNDWVLKAGHRLGVAVMSSNAGWALPDAIQATNTILHDAANPSALVLPVVGGARAVRGAGL
jgi:X-Pro dipeptidyl-peptidase